MNERRGFIKDCLGLGLAAWSIPLLGARNAAAQAKPAAPGKKLGFALVGLGSLSENQIAPALASKTKLCKLTGLVSGHPDKAKAWAQKYGVPEKNIYTYQNFDDIKNNPERLAAACDQMNQRTAAMYLTLAEAWAKKGQAAEAVACYEKVTKLSPNSRQGDFALAQITKIRANGNAVPASLVKP